ncbi:MAG: hypothetical protein KDA88_13555 [Planctomycetaceae bacterium]|nr:hypothetical protein [Planctomycetaceae bacterium]
MRPASIKLSCLFVLMLAWGIPAMGQITAEHRKEITNLTREVPRAAGHIRKKEYDEARAIIDEIEAKIKEIAEAAKVEPTDRAFRTLMTGLLKQKQLLDKAQGTGDAAPVSFVKDVAPIIDQKCVRCHGADNPRKNLRLDTFAGWRRGGQSGPLLAPGNAAASLIGARLSAPMDQGRMPPNGEALADEEMKTIANWINQGAKFDGEGEQMALADLIFQRELKENDVKLPKPKGNETVSFTRDIAPWFSNLCLGCHNQNRKNGGLSVATFFDIMKGGDSGAVIIPGDMENSRLFRLVGGLENPRMPQGQARITRKNYEDLKTWFKEGNAFDGADVRTNISTYVLSDADMAADKFATMTNDDFLAYRDKRSRDQFKRAVPNDEMTVVESDRLLFVGNVSRARLEEVKGWADTRLNALQQMFNDKSNYPWRGRLAVFVMKDRFSYDEFVQTVEGSRAAGDRHGHSMVTANQEDAYIVLHDLGDEATADKPNLHISLIDHLGGAYVKRGGGTAPEWLVRGVGLMLAENEYPNHAYFRSMQQTAKTIAPTVDAGELFDDGAFSPGTIGSVGYSITGYLMKSAGPGQFGNMLRELGQGKSVDAAMQAAFQTQPRTIAMAYLNSL